MNRCLRSSFIRTIWRKGYALSVFPLVALCACSTVSNDRPPAPPPFTDPAASSPDDLAPAQPNIAPAPAPEVTAPPSPPKEAPPEPVYEDPDAFATLSGWQRADPRPALAAFQRGCKVLKTGKARALLNPNLPQYGRYEDWWPACAAAQEAVNSPLGARIFFEDHFAPLTLTSETAGEGLLTGYYEPEVDVRRVADAIYYEPILALPSKKSLRKKKRAELTSKSARVIAYGKPIDVFFLQIQGSGRLKFGDGRVLRAAYAGNNGHPYKSIGRVLIDRGEIKAHQSSKRDIERWMAANGPGASRALINENPRYIFFSEQKIFTGEGPRGAMRVPLTGMASIAVDPRYHPYGSLVWIETTLPQAPGDYRGQKRAFLVAAQDTGSAIKGPLRADLFFGSGPLAGSFAGVMKHPVRWTIFVPKAIAPSGSPVS